MLIARAVLERIRDGEVTLQFRRWTRPTVRAGGTLRTALGVVAIDAVETTSLSRITAADARTAGERSRSSLLATLSERDGTLYRITLHHAGADPRIGLSKDADLDDATIASISARLDDIDTRSRRGPWTRDVLGVVARRPATPAADLAGELGRDRAAFKNDVRRLKELGLTESLELGYRLSPRGEAFVQRTAQPSRESRHSR
ncbi:hypothetical protein ACHAAC_02490 [Aeromicrobium sp. CF4.19]|uniref:hypothetical protein n=1 Tax=Aeromicrobium sp. CF4.19 TaxID=3373082 RepID=UPI003EE5613A